MLILTKEDIKAAITMPQVIQAVREGFIALSTDRATVPVRGVMETPDGVMLSMPAHVTDAPVNVVKIVSVHEANPAQNLAAIQAVVLVSDAKTGVPLALLEGATLTALRTGAASGVATDLLALPDAATLGIIGAGVQARTQIAAVCAVRPITEIRIFSQQGAEQMADELREQTKALVVVADSAHDALNGANVIVTATNSRSPVVTARDVAPGVHINAIGSFTPEMQEIAADVITQARVIVDHRDSVWEEAGELIMARDRGLIAADTHFPEIGEVAAGSAEGRTNADEITFFKSVGNAVQDAVVADRIYALAIQAGMGTEISL